MIAELIPSLRLKGRTKALVTINQMLRTLVNTVEQKPVAHFLLNHYYQFVSKFIFNL